MAVFVLVHGAWHGGWCWKKVAERLRAAGHEVHAPTLTGLGERSHLTSPQVGLSTHIQDVVNLLQWERLEDVVICGHSYGGMVITGVADRAGERLSSMVYLDALIPEHGQRAFDLLLPERVAAVRKAVAEGGDGWRMQPVPAQAFGVTDPDDQAWVDANCVPMAMKGFDEPISLNNGAWTGRRVYVLAGNYDPSPFQPFYARLKDDPDWTTHSLPTGHDVMVTMPDELTDILLAEAK
jgi:pimeloyl-ACP methyl ester carboxylesterase